MLETTFTKCLLLWGNLFCKHNLHMGKKEIVGYDACSKAVEVIFPLPSKESEGKIQEGFLPSRFWRCILARRKFSRRAKDLQKHYLLNLPSNALTNSKDLNPRKNEQYFTYFFPSNSTHPFCPEVKRFFNALLGFRTKVFGSVDWLEDYFWFSIDLWFFYSLLLLFYSNVQ